MARGEAILVSPHDMALPLLRMGAGIVALGLVMFTLGSKVVPAAELTLLSLIEVLLARSGSGSFWARPQPQHADRRGRAA